MPLFLAVSRITAADDHTDASRSWKGGRGCDARSAMIVLEHRYTAGRKEDPTDEYFHAIGRDSRAFGDCRFILLLQPFQTEKACWGCSFLLLRIATSYEMPRYSVYIIATYK